MVWNLGHRRWLGPSQRSQGAGRGAHGNTCAPQHPFMTGGKVTEQTPDIMDSRIEQVLPPTDVLIIPYKLVRNSACILAATKCYLLCLGASLAAQMVKYPPAMRETWVRSLDWGRALEEGNPLQYSCLGSSMDRGARWAAVPGVAESQTGLSN